MIQTLEYELGKDGNGEIIEDCEHPALIEISYIHGKVFEHLTIKEQDKLSKLKGLNRELYIRNKVLQIIQK